MAAIDPDIRIAIDESADRAVKRVFDILGVNIDSPESVESFREDLRFGRGLRRAKERGLLAIAATIGTALAFAVWQGLIQLWTTGK